MGAATLGCSRSPAHLVSFLHHLAFVPLADSLVLTPKLVRKAILQTALLLMTSKEYVDCGVQTDGPEIASTAVQADVHADTICRMIATLDIRGEPTSLSELILSSPRARRRSGSSPTEDNTSLHQSSFGSLGEADEDSVDMTTTSRELNTNVTMSKFPRHRTLKSISARIVSLPETTSLYSARRSVERAKRVVSQPERIGSMQTPDNSSSYHGHLDISGDTLDPFVSETHQRTRARVRSDLPHTPSPPSSPDSIVIIADKSQLPKGFLKNALVVDDPLSESDEDGWITWARSPPRPIPALHGPLSLPYARCPSGAEGTIIEEQENLPRMIWGLESEAERKYDRSDSPPRIAQQLGSHLGTRKSPVKISHIQVPPRFQKIEDARTTSGTTRLSKAIPRYLPTSTEQQPTVHRPTSHEDIDLSLPGHGPIDLSNVLRPRQPAAVTQDQSNGTRNISVGDTSTYLYDTVNGDWQDGPNQDHIKHQALPAAPSNLSDRNGYLTPSVSVSSLSSLQPFPSRSSVSLESLNAISQAQSSMVSNASRRMSALEIAQNYRQQQMHQKSFLPTPPSSSSPLWASRFSPYQGSLVSPDLLAISGLAGHSSKQLTAQDLHQLDVAHQHSLFIPQDASTVIDLNRLKAQIDVSSLAPAAHIQDPILRVQDLSSPIYLRDALPSEPVGPNLGAQRHALPVIGPSQPSAIQSPAPPRPPPNTPLAIVHSRRTHEFSDGHPYITTLDDGPPSPTSPPGRRSRSIAQQQSRVVPLSHLLNRRLSSVPEEDIVPLVGSARSPSPGNSSTRSRNLTGPAGASMQPPPYDVSFAGHQALLVVNSRAHGKLRTPSPGFDRYPVEVAAGSLANPGVKVDPRNVKGRISRPQQDSQDASVRVGRGAQRNNRARGGSRGKRGHSRAPSAAVRNGPERIDGGLTVRS